MTAKSARERAYNPPSFRAGWRDRTDVEETARVFAALSKMTNMPAKAPTRHPMPINATLTPTTSCSVKSAHDSDGQDRGIGRYSGGEVGENNEVRARHTSVRIFIVVLPSCHGARGALLQHRGGAPFDAAPFGSGDSRNGPVAPVSACQNAANSGHSLRQAARRGRWSGDKADRARDIAAIMLRTNRDKAQRLYDELGEALAPRPSGRRRHAMTFT
jgi:hypothetical protein